MLDYINMRLDAHELRAEEAQAVLRARTEFGRGETVSHEATMLRLDARF